MKKVEISRLTAEIATDEIKIVFSTTTGFLDSIVTIPENFEWVGKSGLPFKIKRGKINLLQNIVDVHFVEIYEEDSTGIVQTIVGETTRLNTKLSVFPNLPAILIEPKLLLTDLPNETIVYYPLQFELHKDIDPTKLKIHTLKNHHYLGIKDLFGIIFYCEASTKINLLENKQVNIESQLNVDLDSPREVKLPFSYIVSIPEEKLKMLDLLHLKVIQKYQSHLRKLKEKNIHG